MFSNYRFNKIFKTHCLFIHIAALMMLHWSCKKALIVTLPPSKYENAKSSRVTSLVNRRIIEKTIQFSGYSWVVRPSSTGAGPGPNSWSADNVWVDTLGKLHLKLAKDAITGIWNCAEVYTKTQFGYGKYQFQVEGRVDQLDKNVVFGLFNYSGNDGHDEMDIEFSHWGADYPILNYTIWPKTNNNATRWTTAKDFTLDGTYTTHRFTRSKSSVLFQSLYGFQNDNTGEFFSNTCGVSSLISTLQMPVYINLWLFNGQSPSNDAAVELVINNFTFGK